MAKGDGLPERIGKAANELDIDFGRLTLAGWAVGAVSLAAGGWLAWLVYVAVPPRGGDGRGTGLATGLTMIAVTVGVFLSLRRLLAACGMSLVKDPPTPPRDGPLPEGPT